VLKKATLNPNSPQNYRPITVSSTHSKVLEMFLEPEDIACDHQYGFEKGRGTYLPCILLNDTLQYYKSTGSHLFVCSLDAEKCFDKIWHRGLLHKLKDILPVADWLLTYRWYENLKACVKWQGYNSSFFDISRGIRQGSLLSPIFFNIYIDDLLQDLANEHHGCKVGSCNVNVVGYADDVTLISNRVTDMQDMINKCTA